MEGREVIMTIFLNSLNHEIMNVVELQHQLELEDMISMDTKVER